MTTTFDARYGGTCSCGCAERINPGDEVAYIDGKVLHADCVRDGTLPDRPLSFCSDCWLALPCGCDD